MKLSEETYDKVGIHDYIVVKGANDPFEAENEAELERNTANPEDYEPKVGQDYTEEEKNVDGEHFGEKHKENFLKTLKDNKEKDPDRAEVTVEGSVRKERDAKWIIVRQKKVKVDHNL